MDEKLEKVLLESYKHLQACKEEAERELECIDARINELECFLDDLGLKFETDTIIKEK